MGFPSKSTGVGCHFLLQETFLTQELNPHLLYLLHGRRILYHWTTWKAVWGCRGLLVIHLSEKKGQQTWGLGFSSFQCKHSLHWLVPSCCWRSLRSDESTSYSSYRRRTLVSEAGRKWAWEWGTLNSLPLVGWGGGEAGGATDVDRRRMEGWKGADLRVGHGPWEQSSLEAPSLLHPQAQVSGLCDWWFVSRVNTWPCSFSTCPARFVGICALSYGARDGLEIWRLGNWGLGMLSMGFHGWRNGSDPGLLTQKDEPLFYAWLLGLLIVKSLLKTNRILNTFFFLFFSYFPPTPPGTLSTAWEWLSKLADDIYIRTLYVLIYLTLDGGSSLPTAWG